MLIKITLTKDHIKMLPFIWLQERGDNEIVVDKTHLFNMGSHLLEDMSMVLGLRDTAISGTEDDPEGRAFPDDIENYMLGIHSYLVDNLYYIESLIHQYAVQGGLTPGTYKCKDNDLIWEKISD